MNLPIQSQPVNRKVTSISMAINTSYGISASSCPSGKWCCSKNGRLRCYSCPNTLFGRCISSQEETCRANGARVVADSRC